MRWWDGNRWYPLPEGSSVTAGRPDFRWAVKAPFTKRLNDVLMVLSGVAASVCLIIVVMLDINDSHRYPNVLWLLFVGVPVLLAGQLWTIFVLNARKYPDGPPKQPAIFRGVSFGAIFGGAPKWIPPVMMVLVFTGWSSFLFHASGSHNGSAPDPVGILLFFFALHWGVETAEHYRRKQPNLNKPS
jgi:hypothetical protein